MFFRGCLLATLTMLLAVCGARRAYSHPGAEAFTQAPLPSPRSDFSGRWRMIKDQSNFGGFTVPDIVVRVIEHRDPTLNVHTVQTAGGKTTSADVSYYTDGTSSNNVINGHEATSKAYWDGAALVIRTNMKDSKGEDVVIEDTYQLSDDKQTLTTTSHIETPKGQVDMKLVCTREKAAS